MPDNAPSFAVTAASLEQSGSLKIALVSSGANMDNEGDLSPNPQEARREVKWLYTRKEYLFACDGCMDIEQLFFGGAGAPSFPILLAPEEAQSLARAARAFEAERVAKRYLFRAEHTRFMLERKLIKKGFSAKEAESALDFLESEKTLDDRRFALAWLNTRAALHPEGRATLIAALFERGVSREDAYEAIAAFFAVHDEEELCLRAAQKLRRRGRAGDKLVSSLCRSGFPLRMARRVADSALI